jgi:hypothetical protein
MTSTDQGITAARARVDAVLERLRRVDLQVVVVAPPDATRRAARDRARAAAAESDRTTLFDDAVAATREATLRAFARGGFSGTWAATEMSASIANAGDRVAAAAAFEEAAMAAVVEDLVDDDTLEELRATADELDRAKGLPAPGALSALTAPAGTRAQGPLQVVALVVLVMASLVLVGTFGLVVGLLAFGVGAAVLAMVQRRTGGRA